MYCTTFMFNFVKGYLCYKTTFCHKLALFYLKKKQSFIFKLSRFLCFCEFHRFQNQWSHHRHCYIMEVRLIFFRYKVKIYIEKQEMELNETFFWAKLPKVTLVILFFTPFLWSSIWITSDNGLKYFEMIFPWNFSTGNKISFWTYFTPQC